MLTNNEYAISHDWSLILFFLGALGICLLMLGISFILGGRARARSKNIPFESGVDSLGTARSCFTVKFYLTAMFFVIFDVESIYLYAWSIAMRETGWAGLTEAAAFILTLLAVLFYLVRIKALDWAPSRCSKEYTKLNY